MANSLYAPDMAAPTSLEEVQREFEAYEVLSDDPKIERNRLLIALANTLEPMPDALKTDSTLVRGCNASVWVYPLPSSGSDRLHFLADSNSDLTKGIIALILLTVQDKSAREILDIDIEKSLAPLSLSQHFTSLRTSGLKNMVLKIRETAERLAG